MKPRIEVEGFGTGEGWLLYIGRLHVYWLSRRCHCFPKPWTDSATLYWLRLAFEWSGIA
jgi:hypothetical protein